MVEKKVVRRFEPKLSKIVKVPEDIILSPPKFKTKQVDVKAHIRDGSKVRKHKRTVRKK